jgi:hypothetical protein
MTALLFVALAVVAMGPAEAVDGVTEINQAKALAGGVTPSDGPGFPVLILDTAGSFRLTSNLVVPDADTTAIRVSSFSGPVEVTIDLNGFSIIGPVECERVDTETVCSASGTGSGIDVGSMGVALTVTNGTIRGMGNHGIAATFSGGRTRIDNLIAVSNASNGISVLLTQITNSRAELNGQDGVSATDDGGVIRGCSFRDNGNYGLYSTAGNGIGDNAFYGNTAGAYVGGAVLSPNVCGAALCP